MELGLVWFSDLRLGTLICHQAVFGAFSRISENHKPWALLTPELSPERHSCARPLAGNAIIRKEKLLPNIVLDNLKQKKKKKRMYVFPKISLRPEVENYLKESFLNEEVGHLHRCLQNSDTAGEAERKLKGSL